MYSCWGSEFKARSNKVLTCSWQTWHSSLDYKIWRRMHSGLLREVLFRWENIGRQDDLANFWHFLTWIQSFFNAIEFLGLNKVNWVEKRLKSCEKKSKICQIILSGDVFTTKQNLGKHSTVHNLSQKEDSQASPRPSALLNKIISLHFQFS